jgi:hypothetical protein
MKTFTHPETIQVGSKVRVIGGPYSITAVGSEGVVICIDQRGKYKREEYLTIKFYKTTGDPCGLNTVFRIAANDVEII